VNRFFSVADVSTTPAEISLMRVYDFRPATQGAVWDLGWLGCLLNAVAAVLTGLLLFAASSKPGNKQSWLG
jgi:hypothetical protein